MPLSREGSKLRVDINNTRYSRVPTKPLITFDGTIGGKKITVLKDDGCNTNVLSKDFVQKHRDLLNIRREDTIISHSDKRYTESSSEIIVDAEIEIGAHRYRSNWVVANCRYDMLLGMPWHEFTNPDTDYIKKTVRVGDILLPISSCCDDQVKVCNIGVKKFRSLLKKKKTSEDFVVLQVSNITSREESKHHTPGNQTTSMDTDTALLLEQFSEVFRDDLPAGLPPKRSVDHTIEIEEDSKPPHRPIFQLSPAELLATKEYIVDLLKKGKIRPSRSPYGAPLFFVKQKGKLRGVIDYRALNRITKPNNTPIPRSDEMFDRLGQAEYFSKLDLKSGFHQIRVAPEDIEKTAFNTKYGHFEFLVMPMGLRNSPATFQTLMNEIFYDHIGNFIVIYLDDILIYSDNREDHFKHLRIVLERLKENQLYVGKSKCEIMTEETEFLGLKVGKDGIKIGKERKKLVRDWPKPTNISELRGFIGLLQFFRRFIRNFSALAAPITHLTRKGRGIKEWDEECAKAFGNLKELLVQSPIMIDPNWSRPFRCHTDASQLAVGGSLTQLDEHGDERVISYFSKRLSPAEENHSANDRELLGLIYFLRRFRCYLEGSSFEVLTDNQVLKNFFSKATLSRREAGWVEFLGQFGISSMTLIKGKVHVLGDALSRAPHITKSEYSSPELSNVHVLEIELPPNITKNYETDQLFGPIYSAMRGNFPEDSIQRDRIERLMPSFQIQDGLLFFGEKICIPRRNVNDLLRLAHDCKISGHFSVAKTLSRLNQVHWKNKSKDVELYCQGCLTCQTRKDGRVKPLGVPQPLQLPQRRWGSISLDFITHLPETNMGHNAIITFVDRATKRVHIVPSKEEDTAEDVAKKFFDHIFKLHGLPDDIVSDRDPKFTSRFWTQLTALCGISLKMSTSRHPQADRATEIMNRMISNYLRCYCAHNQRDWDELLTSAEFAYNSALVESMGMTPFEADIGWNPRSPLDMLSRRSDLSNQRVDDMKKRLSASFEDAKFAQLLAQSRQAAYNGKKYQPPSYSVGDEVFISKKLFTPAASSIQPSKKLGIQRYGPFRILELIGKNAIRVDLPDSIRIHPVIHVEHTTRRRSQPDAIRTEEPTAAQPFTDEKGELVLEVSEILAHRKRGKGHQFLTLYKNSSLHEAEWKPLRDFLDTDGTITAALHRYLIKENILSHLH